MHEFLLKASLLLVSSAVDCGRLRSPENGQVMIVTTRFGGVAKYSCNDGFGLRGVSIRRCGPDGEWTGREPICRGR